MLKHYLISFLFLCLLGIPLQQAEATTPYAITASLQKEKAYYHNGQLIIDGMSDIKSIEVYDILGKRVFQTKVVDKTAKQVINVSLRSKNMYIVRVQTTATRKSFKIVAM